MRFVDFSPREGMVGVARFLRSLGLTFLILCELVFAGRSLFDLPWNHPCLERGQPQPDHKSLEASDSVGLARGDEEHFWRRLRLCAASRENFCEQTFS